jgi:transcriptional regulator with XRE-family HTH domain
MKGEIRLKGKAGIARALYVTAKEQRVVTKISDLHRRWSKAADYKDAYDALGEEFDLARTLIEARTAAGLSPSQLARRMKTSQSYIARIEGGKVRPSTNALERFAQATRTRLRICLRTAVGALNRDFTNQRGEAGESHFRESQPNASSRGWRRIRTILLHRGVPTITFSHRFISALEQAISDRTPGGSARTVSKLCDGVRDSRPPGGRPGNRSGAADLPSCHFPEVAAHPTGADHVRRSEVVVSAPQRPPRSNGFGHRQSTVARVHAASRGTLSRTRDRGGDHSGRRHGPNREGASGTKGTP